MRSRRRGRELLVQALYAAELGGMSLEQAVADQLARRTPGPEVRAFVEELAAALEGGHEDRDRRIDAVVEGRTPERVGVVERAILRLALAELDRGSDVPPAVVLSEAVELARTFSSEESARFVNGVLDRLLRERQGSGS